MDARVRLLLVVVGLALVATPAFVYPNGGLATYEYEVRDGPYVVANFADRGEHVDCHIGLESGACALARYARDHDGIVVRDAAVGLPEAVTIVDDGVIERYWVETTETEDGTRITVAPIERIERVYELVATPVDALPQPARAALEGQSVMVSGERPPGEYGYLVEHDGEWHAVERTTVRQAGMPFWGDLLRAIAPPVGGLLLGFVAAGGRN